MPHELPRLLERCARTRLCLADWRTLFGEHYDLLRPLLTEVIGKLTTTYPTEISGIRFDLDIRKGRYMGYVPPDYEITGVDSRWFEVEDLQLWALDPDKVAAFLGPANASHVADKPIVKVVRDFDVIIMPDGRSISFGRKYKRRAFLREVVKYCRDNDTDLIHAQRVIADYNASLKEGDDSPKAIRTSDVVYDLFKGQSDVFKELFDIRDLSAGLFQLKVAFEAP